MVDATKLNREQRRALAKDRKKANKAAESVSWAEAEGIYQTSVGALGQLAGLLSLLDSVKEFLSPEDQAYADASVTQLKNDSDTLLAELDTIHATHAELTGECGIDDIMDFFTVAQAYEAWYTRLNMLITPTQDAILDVAMRGELAKEAKAKESIPDAATLLGNDLVPHDPEFADVGEPQ